jgi:hypothetical protein
MIETLNKKSLVEEKLNVKNEDRKKSLAEESPAEKILVEKIQNFNGEDWKKSFERLLKGNDTQNYPELEGFELIEKLNRIYGILDRHNLEQRFLFAESLIKFLRNIPVLPQNYSFIETLILFIHDKEPSECRHSLECLVRDSRFPLDIQLFLIKAYTNIEDVNQLFICDYLSDKKSLRADPYFIYIQMNYYVIVGKYNEALESLCDLFKKDGGITLNEEACDEVYHALEVSVPNYISVDKLLNKVTSNELHLNFINSHLRRAIERFISYLKENTDIEKSLSAKAEKVFNDKLNRSIALSTITNPMLEEIVELIITNNSETTISRDLFSDNDEFDFFDRNVTFGDDGNVTFDYEEEHVQ